MPIRLLAFAFLFALAYEKCGLGKRIALTLVKLMGHRTLTLGYAVVLADAVLALVGLDRGGVVAVLQPLALAAQNALLLGVNVGHEKSRRAPSEVV